MKVVYAGQTPPDVINKSIFLAGPTPRRFGVQSWRPEALAVLELLEYDGVVFVPENPPENEEAFNDWSNNKKSYASNVDWEDDCLSMADCILFWIPRDLKTMPAFTTNDEWGSWKYSGKTVLGAPDTAVKVRYQKHYAEKLEIPFANTLAATVQNAATMVSKGVPREKGERNIPLMVWNTASFQSWYESHTAIGNYLESAEVLWSFRVGPGKKFVFAYTIHVDIHIKAEGRNKVNEFVFFRTDISSVVLYHNAETFRDSELVLVKEFRSPVRNEEGFVYEVPGGSSFKPGRDPKQVASDEVFEETGFRIDPERFRVYGNRQVAATLSTHHAYMFAAEINDDELYAAKQVEAEGSTFGNEGDSERTYVKVVTMDDVLEGRVPVDWSMLGMILRAMV